MYPPEAVSSDGSNTFSGFQIVYKDDRLVKWDPIIGRSEKYVEWPSHGNSVFTKLPSNTNVLSLSLVSATNLINSTYIETPDLPHLGFVSIVPDLSISNIKSVDIKEDKMLIRLAESDGKVLGEITSKNLGERLLISMNRVPILAPPITMPITTGQIQISRLTSNQSLILYSNLQSMAIEP